MQIVLNEGMLFLDVVNGDDDFGEDDLLMMIIVTTRFSLFSF